MKTKNFIIAMAIFGGVLFMASSATQYNLDAQDTAELIKKGKRKIVA